MAEIDSGRLSFSANIDNAQLKKDAERAKGILSDVGNSAEKEGNRIDEAFQKIGKSIAAVFTVAQATAFTREIIKVRGEVESLEKSFRVLAGAEYGQQLFNDIRQFTLQTPMLMQDLAQGAQTMLAFNIAAQDIMPVLRALGDVSMGDSQRFQSLTLAFSQMTSQGQLTGRTLMQMVNSGFNPLVQISEKTGKSLAELRAEMSKGAISADMVKQAFMDATSEGGKFYGMLEDQSKGIAGQLSNLQGAIEEMFNSIGENTEGIITGAIQSATNLANNYEEVGRVIAELVATFGVYKAALITINALTATATSLTAGWTAAELAEYNALLLVEKAQALLNATILKNPYVLAAAAVASLAYGMYKLITYQNDAEKAQAKLNETTKQYESEVVKEKVHIDTLFARLKAAQKGTEEYEKAKKAIINQYGEYLQGLSDEAKALNDVEAAYRGVVEAAREAAKARTLDKAMQQAEDTRAAQEDKALKSIKKTLQDLYGNQTDSSGMNLAEKYFWQFVEGTYKQDKSNPINSQFQTNAVKSLQYYAKQIEDAEKQYYETSDEIERLYKGYTVRTTSSNTGEGEEVQEVVKDRKYWEDYVKEQQGLLNAMGNAENNSKEAQRIRQNIQNAQKIVDSYDVKNGTSSTDSQQQKENTLALQTKEREELILKLAEGEAEANREAQFLIEQERIDAMKDGLEKELAQNDLNYKILMAAIEKREQEMLERRRDIMQAEWQNANPNYREQGLSFDRRSVTTADLDTEQLAALTQLTNLASEQWERANKESLEKMLDDVLTYEQQRTKISEEYERRRQAMYTTDENGNQVLRAGVTEGNVAELDRAQKEALDAIDEAFAQREETYKAWAEQITNWSLEKLQEQLEKAQEELKRLEESGESDSVQLSQARARVNTMQQEINKQNARNEVSPGARSMKEWEDLYKTLNECNNSFKEMGEQVDGVAGDIIRQLGSISTASLSMVNGIETLVKSSASAIEGTAEAGVTALSTMEKASVILTVISAALQMAMAIVNLFNNDNSYQKEIDKLQRRIDQLQWELDNMDAVRLEREAGNAVENLRQTIYDAKTELYGYYEEITGWYNRIKWATAKASKDAELMGKTVEKLADYYGSMNYTADKALGTNSWQEAREELNNIAQQMVLVNEQLDAENAKKKTDKDTVQEYEQTLAELAEQAENLINEMVEDIMGGSASDLAQKLGDALIEAFEAGEDAAEKWGETVNDIVKDIIKNLIVTELIEEPIGELFNKYKEKWFPNGDFSSVDVLNESINDFAAEMNDLYYGVVESAQAIWDALDEQLGLTETDRTASEKGIATASQESVDELNGRATAIQSHTYSINENTKMLLSNSNNILESVLNIELYTSLMSTRLETVESGVSDMRTTLNDFSLHGIKIK